MFYRIPKTVLRDRGENTVTPSTFDSVVLYVGTQWVYMHGNPSPDARKRLAKHGAEKIADTWRELKGKLSTAQRKRVFRKTVRRSITDDSGTSVRDVQVSMDDVEAGDVVLQEFIVPHKFLGEPDPAPVD